MSYYLACLGVRFAYLGVPGSVSRGDSIWLDCGYDLEGDELYSVKWYKDNVEFYRFLPSDKPSAQMYSLDGVFLDLHLCKPPQIALTDMILVSESIQHRDNFVNIDNAIFSLIQVLHG
ncbi:ig-like domain-containing protein [Caerostris darwini]|uniref:Ig-like domain-containing protein n=1 Tax=Caerostris darwini TaxID=1538125 RepID=A0AAV4STM6_9ARAC|nr:ig-like domain-containing protein [Caerostris darwini]